MDIDLAALRALERERDISLDVLIPAIEQALLVAYHRTDGSQRIARVELDRKTGHVIVWAREEGELLPVTEEGERPQRGEPGPEFDDTPVGFGRIAASTATPGHPPAAARRSRTRRSSVTSRAARATSSPASSSRASDPDNVLVDFGTRRGASCRSPSRCPGERYVHGERLRCFVVSVKRGPKRARRSRLSRTHPNLVNKLFALEVPEIADGTVEIAALAREAGHRTKIAVHSQGPGRQRQGRLHRPDGARVRAHVMTRAARREDRHRRLGRRPGDLVAARAVARPGCSRSRSSTRRPGPLGSSCPTTSFASRSARRARTPASPPGSPAGASTSAPTPTRRADPPPVVATTLLPTTSDRSSRGARGAGDRPDAVDFVVADRTGLRAEPSRTCVGCRGTDSWSALLRVVAATDGDSGGKPPVTLLPDPRHRMPGRGAWLHPTPDCLELAVRRKAFGRALRLQVAVDVSAVARHLEVQHP